MSDDEQAIRKLIEEWHRATGKGELPEILKLMDEDVVFLVAGKPPMRGRMLSRRASKPQPNNFASNPAAAFRRFT